MNKIFEKNNIGAYDYYPCGDSFEMTINSGNSDANCHRVRPSYSKQLVVKDNSVCIDCVYNNTNYGETQEENK